MIPRMSPTWFARLSRVFGPERCLFGSNFPIEKLWTSYAELLSAPIGTRCARLRPRNSRRSCTTRRCASIGSRPETRARTQKVGRESCRWKSRFSTMATSSSKSSFLVLGRDCGRTRRVPTLGFLILGGAYPIRRRHRLPLEPDHGDARHARAAVPREHDREPAFQAWRAHGRRPLRAAHPPAHRSRRQGRSLSHEFDRGRQSPRARIFGLRPHASAISRARHQASDRPLARQERAALPRPRDQRPDRTDARRLSARPRARIPKGR